MGREGRHLLGQGPGDARGRKSLGAHGGEHRDAEGRRHVPAIIRRALLGAALTRFHHGGAAHGVHGEHIGPAGRCRARRALYLMRDVVELQVEEHVEAAALEHLHDGRALRVVQRHADLEPLRVALQLVGQGYGLPGVAVERHDDAVASGNGIEGG